MLPSLAPLKYTYSVAARYTTDARQLALLVVNLVTCPSLISRSLDPGHSRLPLPCLHLLLSPRTLSRDIDSRFIQLLIDHCWDSVFNYFFSPPRDVDKDLHATRACVSAYIYTFDCMWRLILTSIRYRDIV